VKPEYQDWIDANVRECYGKCAEVTRQTGVCFAGIWQVCNGRGKSAGGFGWRYFQKRSTVRRQSDLPVKRDRRHGERRLAA